MVSPNKMLSISVVTYRTDIAMLQTTIASLAQSTVPFDLLIVDNSQDDSYFQELSQKIAARCIRAPRNGGYGYGHNYALANIVTDAPYHLVLNPDVEVHAGCLETLLAQMEAEPDIALAVPLILNTDGSVQELNKRDPSVLDLALRRFAPQQVLAMPWAKKRMALYVRADIGYGMPSEVPYASGCFMLFRRTVLDAIGGFDERYFMYFEDADITRAARALGKVMFLPEARITHGWQRGSHHNFRLMVCTLSSAYRYFRKWGVRWA